MPRDRAGTFEPQIVRKRQRRLTGVDEMVLSLYAKGLTTGEISAHFAEIYGASVSKETITRITDKVMEEMADWQQPAAGRGLRGDLHRRDHGQGAGRAGRQPARLRCHRRHRGRRAGHPGPVGRDRRGGRQVLDERADRTSRTAASGTCASLVCDGLKGLPEVVGNVWPKTIVQTCIVHLIRNTFQLRLEAGLGRAQARPQAGLHRASNAEPPGPARPSSPGNGGQRYPAIIRLWENAWAEFVPFLDYDLEIRTVICTTNAIESMNARLPAGGQGPRPLPDRAGGVSSTGQRNTSMTEVLCERWRAACDSGRGAA